MEFLFRVTKTKLKTQGSWIYRQRREGYWGASGHLPLVLPSSPATCKVLKVPLKKPRPHSQLCQPPECAHTSMPPRLLLLCLPTEKQEDTVPGTQDQVPVALELWDTGRLLPCPEAPSPVNRG